MSQAPLEFERIACPLCGARAEEPLLAAPDWKAPKGPLYRLVRCRQCDMGYQNPRPTPQCMAQFYPQDYGPYESRPVSDKPPSLKQRVERIILADQLGYPPVPSTWFERLLSKLFLPVLRPHVDSHTAIPFIGQGHLLDVGCGSGWFALRMQERGWKVTGLDISEQMVEQVQRLGIPAFAGTLPHPGLKPASFDVVNLGAVLEHVHDPHAVIESAVQLLRPGGLFVASVPNRQSWGFDTFGVDWWPLELPRHTLFFTPTTLRRLLEAHGFVVTQLRQLGRTGWMRRSLRFAGRAHGWARWLNHGPLPGWLTRWTIQRGGADCLFVVARKPESAVLPLAA